MTPMIVSWQMCFPSSKYYGKINILFINGSPNKEGNTARLAGELLAGKEYKSLHLVDYKLYSYGQKFEDE